MAAHAYDMLAIIPRDVTPRLHPPLPGLSPSQSAPPPGSSGGSFLGGSPPRLSSASSLPGNLAKRSASPESPGRKKASLFSFGSSKKKEELRGQVGACSALRQASLGCLGHDTVDDDLLMGADAW